MKKTVISILSTALCLLGGLHAADENPAKPVLRDEEIFDSKKVWDVHLTFTTGEWAAMEPKQGQRAERAENRSFLLGPEGGRNGIAAAFGYDFPLVRSNVDFGTQHLDDVAARYKGNGTFLGSRETLKRSIKLDLNHFSKGQKLGGLTQINLHNSFRDPSNMNEAVSYRLFRDGKVPAPRTSYAKVYVTVPDKYERKYFGLYNVVEDVGNSFAEEHFKTKEGVVLKPVTPQLFSDMGDDWKNYNQTYDPKGRISDEQKKRIIDTCKFVTKSEGSDFAAGIGSYIDLDNFARYMALTVWLSDLDGILGPGQNYYVYLHPKTQKFVFIPWDQDQPFGQFLRGSQEQREQLSIKKPWVGENLFLGKIFEVEAFRAKYVAALREFSETILKPERISGQVDELAEVLRAPITEESETRLVNFNKLAAGEPIELPRSTGFNGGLVKPIKLFVKARAESVNDQLEGRSEGQVLRSGGTR